MKRALITILLAHTASSLSPIAASAQAFVSPLVVESPPAAITVANSGTDPLRLSVSLGDFDQDSAGLSSFTAVGHSPHSCGSRLRVSEAPTQIAPRSEIRLSVTLAPGDTCWGAVLVHVSTGLTPGARIAVKVYSIPSGAVRSADVAGIAVRRDSLRVEIVNTGPTPMRPRGRIELRTADGTAVWSSRIQEFGLHPGVRRSLDVPIVPRVPAGRYVALAVFDIGLPDLIAGEARVELKPSPSTP
jgi:hypothetical protein